MSAVLLFDQINIQRALANGTSLDDITTSGTDPTAPFTLHSLDLFIYGFWLTSLTLSLVTSFFAILVDASYCHYVSPIAGQPRVQARTRHLRYKGLLKSSLRTWISFLQLLLHLSLISFLLGLALFASDQTPSLFIVLDLIFSLISIFYIGAGLKALKNPESPWKTPITYILSAIFKHPAITTVPRLTPSLEVNNLSEIDNVQASEIYAAHKSRIENEVDALHWLYERSSTSAIHRLVIQALAGLSPDYGARAHAVFRPLWVELRDEKERMLMDCMELAQDGLTRWIPKDIPNIGGRIEPLLRLEILFPALRREFPSRLFGEHNLDFSRKLSNTLSITLSSVDDAHIQKPTEQRQVVMRALAENSVHHPLVWKKLLGCYVDNGRLFYDARDIFTIEMCLKLVTSIYIPNDSPQELCSCTLADASVTYYKPEILNDLLSVFSTSESQNDSVDPERRLSLAIVRALVPNSALSTNISHQPHPLHDDSTISKYRLLCIAIGAIQKVLRHHPIDPPSKEWRTNVFRAIVSFMMSDLFTGRSLSDLEYSEIKDTFWTGSTYTLACMASFIDGDPEYCVIEPNAEWDTKPLFLNIIQVIHDERVADVPSQTPFPVYPDRPQRVDSAIGAVSLLLDQAFKRGIPGVYEAFREKGTLRYVAEKSRLHLDLIEGLQAYINGLSDAKAGKFPDIQSDEFPDRHIHDLHEAPVIRCICASIAHSGLTPRPILSSLASIDPNNSRWTEILDTLNSPDHEYSVNNYSFDPIKAISSDDQKRLKKSMKKTLRILAECLKAERARRNGTNWVRGW